MLHALKNLPRDARDTLFLLAVIAWVVAPQVNNLPVWCSVMTAAILLWRGFIAVQGQPLPSRGWTMGLLVLAVGATYYSHRTLAGRDGGVTIIVVLLALKTLEVRAQRDAFVVFFLSFFTLLTNFFFSQSLLTAAAMLVGLLGLLTALVNSHMPVGRPPLMEAAKTAAWMALLGAPIMAILFVLFPRIAPLWGMPDDATSGRSGLSASMQVGTIASLALDSSVAMRVKFAGAPPLQGEMYFRGPVLSTFDGREWRPLQSAPPPATQPPVDLEVSGQSIDYQVTLEGNNRPWVLVLDATPAPPNVRGYTPSMTPDLQWVVERPIADLVRYSAKSHMAYRLGPTSKVRGLQAYRDLPIGFNPRTQQLATEIRSDPRYATADTAALVEAVMQRLRTGGYTYTLAPGVFGTHTADEFWFDRRTGFCEHIASSFVLLMRAMGVPARVVTGYQGGEVNAVDGLWTVRQSDAHAWTEVWMANKGWVRVDPTGAVSPGRIGSLLRLQAPTNVFARALSTVSPRFTLNLRALWDAANNNWNQWVLNYTQSKQMNMLRNLGFESPSWADLSYVLIAVVVSASLVAAAWTLWDRHRQDPWLRLLHAAAQRLKQAAIPLPAQAPPRAMASALRAHWPTGDPGLDAVCQWLLRLETWRYAANSAGSRAALGTLQREFRQLPWPRRAVAAASTPLSP